MYFLRYPLVSNPSEYVVVGTTRPETLFGDMVLAVNPEDERYTHLVGKKVRIPLTNREIPIIADEYPDPEKGTGVVKITPAHDFNDFEVGERHNLDLLNIMDIHGCLNENVPSQYQGLDRFEARKKVIQELEEQELLDHIDDHKHLVPHGDRSVTPLEPRLTDQWFVNAEFLAKEALKAVEDGSTIFVPSNWKHTYFEWLRNIRPWCISRQIVWGHRIPAWYGPDGEVFVSESIEDAKKQAMDHYKKEVELVQDNDVLDTWFSSALWPFSTLGWPKNTVEFNRYYSTDVLVTGFDIIFFWVARMMMMGLHFCEKVPFKVVYIHPLIRDEKGQKMSKTKGNVIDPLDLIEKYGTDALRFTLCSMATHTRDVRMSTDKVEGARNFATKLWNSAKYAQMQKAELVPNFHPLHDATLTINRWIGSVIENLGATVTKLLDEYHLHDAANELYAVFRNDFCDWYIEFTKPVLTKDGDAIAIAETKATMAWALQRLLVFLHPIMPYITDTIWSHIKPEDASEFLLETSWPEARSLDEKALSEMQWVIDAISSIRAMRSELNVPVASFVEMASIFEQELERSYFIRNRVLIERLARVSVKDTVEKPLSVLVGTSTFNLNIRSLIDIEVEKARLLKEKVKVEADLKSTRAKLGNADFIAKAKEDVIQENKDREVMFSARVKKLERALDQL
jgi:valyl-tRNA synthetase